MNHPDKPRLQRLLDDYFVQLEGEVAEHERLDPELSVDEAMLITVVTDG